ncbi:hypothetical protein ATI61_11560 [Archangium gephyra]|uniref:Uncharacterized protein n=1 Tax=Archangium gephyra TaxID=48 RepID=A0AAC8QAE9_9BACT|nr:hypothetical protein [Archangium gephyra]AKJ03471.1 Hypothetical protein AA314_05097 [Archangium gephyra]REG24021.1 hypothetical protein ATI61_11560 [Archangium gephyra]
MTELQWPPRGNFGYKALVGPHQYEPARLIETDRGYFGLTWEGALHYGSLRDEEGHLYSLTRRFCDPSKGGHNNFIVQSTRNDDGCLHFDPSLFKGAASGTGVVTGVENGSAFRRSPVGVEGRAYEIVYAPNSLSWREQDVMQLTGRLCGPGLHWYLPQTDVGTYYASAMFQVEGTLGGRRVRGFICADTVFMREGSMLYGADDPLAGHHTHVTWYTWGTRYKDGSFEGGHFSSGHDRFGFALYTNDREQVVATTNVEALVKPGEDNNFPKAVYLRADDALWEFIPDPKGRMPDFLGKSQPSTPQNEGRWRRVGDTREPDVWFAWGETSPATGVERKLRYRF